MMLNSEAQELFNTLDSLRNAIRSKRITLAMSGVIPAEWPLDDKDAVIAFITIFLDKTDLSPEEKKKILNDIKSRLDSRGSILLDLQSNTSFAGLSTQQEQQILSTIKPLLASRITVAQLEGVLLDLQSRITNDWAAEIIAEIADAGNKIKNATNELQIAIEKLEDLNELFGTIAVAINIAAYLIGISAGNFGAILPLINQIFQVATE